MLQGINRKTVALLLDWVYFVTGWHGFMNTDYHCWPLSANAANPTPFNPCKGIDIRWIEAPPDEVVFGVKFNATAELMVHPLFYTWGSQHDLFLNINGSTGTSDPTSAQEWCEQTVCPPSNLATEENCCVHHFNLHSCPSNANGMTNNLCGPWIPPQGQVFTHSIAVVGQIHQGNWTSHVKGLTVLGETSIIAHFKIAGMHLALVKKVIVLPQTVCGDNVCELAETCSTCPSDCGRCSLGVLEISVISVICTGTLMGVFVFLCYIQLQRRNRLYDESWIIPYCKISTENLQRFMGSLISRISNNLEESSALTGHAVGEQIFITTARIDGKIVALKKINKKCFILSKKIRSEVQEVRNLQHQNLCQFVGGCIEVPHVCILMEYCAKGSLADVLLNDDIPLSWSFRFSFASDVSRGMEYLHNHSIVHSRLNSSNCVIDDRWSVKITDYGLPSFRLNDFEAEEINESQKRRTNVYRAPELDDMFPCYTRYTDVYAYGIILIEIAIRNDPFGDEDVLDLPDRWYPPLPNFEKLDDGDEKCPCPKLFCAIIESCLMKNPIERPTFSSIRKMIYRANPNKQNPVDLMMSMMEKYSKHLEQIVAERTNDLIIEKQRTDRLLYSMLPKVVADVLRQGNAVSAQFIESCTIFFSDIVGFTILCSNSTAMDVVNLLNTLYITFDQVIEIYQVYKVETIGDAYMVASGVPDPNPKHAVEIANMALNLVKICKTFIIPHHPGQTLKIRIGIHSGSVCAGVVGLKMPRYCLFGDSVNTASRMESNGEAYKIHVSENTYHELQRHGGFQFEPRGIINVKGKGEMRTYWLVGKTDAGIPKSTKEMLNENTKISKNASISQTGLKDDMNFYIDDILSLNLS